MDALVNYSRESDDDDDVLAIDSSNGRKSKPERSAHTGKLFFVDKDSESTRNP